MGYDFHDAFNDELHVPDGSQRGMTRAELLAELETLRASVAAMEGVVADFVADVAPKLEYQTRAAERAGCPSSPGAVTISFVLASRVAALAELDALGGGE